MRTLVKDYIDLCKTTSRFYKNHWKGLVVMNAVAIGAGYVVFFKDEIKAKVKTKNHKEEESE